MEKYRYITLCGLSGLGKSYYSRWLFENLPNSFWIETDSLRAGLTGSKSDLSHEDDLWKVVIPNYVTERMTKGGNIILDSIAPYARARKSMIGLADEFRDRYTVECHYFMPDLDLALSQNKLRGKGAVPKAVITRQFHNWETPQLSEGFDKIIQLKAGNVQQIC